MMTRARRLITAGTAAALFAQALAACGPAVQPQAGNSAATPQPQGLPVTTAKIERQTIVTQANYGGSIQSRSQVTVLPRAGGRVLRLPVDVGASVKAGDLLAELDHTTNDAQVAQAQANLNNARASLASAQARLATVLAGAKSDDVAVAQAQLDAANIKLQQVLAGGRIEDIQAAQASVDSARTRLDAAQSGGRVEDILAAQAQLDAAKNRLAQVIASGRPEDVRAAESNLASSKAKLAALLNPRPEDVAAAQATLDQAKTRLAQVQDAGTGTNITARAKPEDLANAQLVVQNAQVAYDKAMADAAIVGKTGGPVTAQASEAAIKTALVNLQTAQNNYNKLLNQGPTEWDVRLLQETMVSAQAAYDKLIKPSPADVAAAQASVDQAQSTLDKLKSFTQFDLDAAQAAVDQAQANLDKARNPDPSNVATLQSTLATAVSNLQKLQTPSQFDIDAAQAAVNQAQATLNSRKNPFTDQDRQAAQAAVTQAQATVDQQQAALAIQQANLNEAFVVAPFDGIISDRPVSEGAVVAVNTALMTLISKDVDIALNVEEVNISKFQENTPATFTVNAYPGEQFKGNVASVFPSGDTRSRTFTVKVRPFDQSGRLRAGMFAQLTVDLERRDNVPVISKDAIITRNDKPTAFAVVDNVAALRQLTLGLGDDKRVEVLSGLQAGEDVVISGQATLRDKDQVRIVTGGQRPAGQAGAGGPGGQPGQQGAAGAAGAGGAGGAAGQAGQRPAGQAGQPGQAGGAPQGQATQGAAGGQRPAGTPAAGQAGQAGR